MIRIGGSKKVLDLLFAVNLGSVVRQHVKELVA
jgi:hypothetical protein